MEEIVKMEVNYLPATIEMDFDSLNEKIRKEIDTIMDGFDPSMMTEEKETDLRTVRSAFNSGAKDLDDRRKQIKKEYNAPYLAFEQKAKESINLYKDAADKIGSALDSIVEARKNARIEVLKEHYEEYAPILMPVVSFEKILDNEWLRKNVSEKSALIKLEDAVDDVSNNWELFKTMDIPFKPEAEVVFFDTLSLKAAKEESERLVAAEKASEEKKQRISQMKQEVAEFSGVDISSKPDVTVATVATLTQDKQAEEGKSWYSLEFSGTEDDAKAVIALLYDRQCIVHVGGDR